MSHINRFRGDTASLGVTVKLSTGKAYNLTGCTLQLSISKLENPATAEDVIQTTTAVIDEALAGKAHFEFANGSFDFVGDYYYDVELTDIAGKTKTIVKSTMKLTQDITKGA